MANSQILKLMVDILNRLRSAAASATVDGNDQQEKVTSTFLRLIGVTDKVDITGNDATAEEQEDNRSLVDQVFKSKDPNDINNKKIIVKYLENLKQKIEKVDNTRNALKIQRIERQLIPTKDSEIDTESLVQEGNLTQTLNNIETELQKATEEPDSSGYLTNEIKILDAVTFQTAQVISALPSGKMGGFESNFISLIKERTRDIETRSKKQKIKKKTLEVELRNLQNVQALLDTGVDPTAGLSEVTEDGESEQITSGEQISLRSIIDTFIYLANENKASYKCKNCKFFDKNAAPTLCTYAGGGAKSLENDKQVATSSGQVGRRASSREDCNEVWDLPKNDYFRPNNDFIAEVKKILKKTK